MMTEGIVYVCIRLLKHFIYIWCKEQGNSVWEANPLYFLMGSLSAKKTRMKYSNSMFFEVRFQL
jgi:hypothetical protein